MEISIKKSGKFEIVVNLKTVGYFLKQREIKKVGNANENSLNFENGGNLGNLKIMGDLKIVGNSKIVCNFNSGNFIIGATLNTVFSTKIVGNLK